MPNRRDGDPIGNFNFLVEIEGVQIGAGFQEVTGLYSETEVIEYRSGNDHRIRKMPGQHHYGDITLQRGYDGNQELWNWRKAVTNGEVARRSGSIILLESDRSEVKRWNFYEAWPSKWIGPLLASNQNSYAIETLVLTCERIEEG